MISLVINGQARELQAPVSVAEYLGSLGLDSQHVAVAHNGVVLDRSQFAQIGLADGDRVEIVRPVGGG
jgi:thiamine biosynthesis protein ThiS